MTYDDINSRLAKNSEARGRNSPAIPQPIRRHVAGTVLLSHNQSYRTLTNPTLRVYFQNGFVYKLTNGGNSDLFFSDVQNPRNVTFHSLSLQGTCVCVCIYIYTYIYTHTHSGNRQHNALTPH
jgi:hypothetical protein